MGEGQQDEYEERLQEVFHSFDASGAGSLCPAELAELCQALHLDEAAPVLLHALLQNQDRLDGRVDFDQFKDALILVLSSTVEQPAQPSQDASTQPDSPELHPKFVKGSKRYGRRSTPEFIETTSDFRGMPEDGEEEEREEEHPQEGSDDGSTVPRKRERWTTEASSPEEYEAEGQLHLWNPDEPGTPRASAAPPCGQLEEQLRQACQELALPWHGQTTHAKLQALCQRLGMEISEEAFQALDREGVMNVQEFVSYVLVQNQPPTPSASTPYRQLKRHHSVQAFDETGRRIATPSTMSGTIGMRLFSSLDDGTGYTPVEYLLDAWMEEGIENSPEILKALDFSLDGKVNLSELTAALENELLITKNGLHQAALASFKVEIRHLLERVDLELREKEKIRSDLEKAERLKTQLASEVDEHHSAIERMNDINLRKQEHEHKEKLAAVRAELTREMDLIQQQANLQREEMEAEIEKIRDDENFLREHLTLTIKDNGRLEAELLDSTEKLVEAENHVDKLQRNLDNILREKFGDLDPDSAEFFLQEDRLRQLRNSYEEQCRELQDRIDELQAQLEEYHVLGRAPPTSIMPSLSDELENMSPGMESDPGLGSEEGQPFNMSLEAEMMYEQLKEQHSREVEHVQAKLETKASEYNQRLEEQRASHEKLSTQLTEQHQEEVQVLKQEVTRALEKAQSLQAQLEHVKLEQQNLEQSQALQLTELQKCHEEEASHLQQELQQARSHTEELEAQLRTLDGKLEAAELSRRQEKEELDELYKKQLSQMELLHQDMLKARAAEERAKLQEEMEEMQRKLREEFERERQWLEESQKEVLRAELEGEKQKAEEKCKDLERKLEEEWEKQRAQLEEGNKMALQVLVEEELLRLVKEQEERERKHTEQWKLKQCELEDQHAAKLQSSLAEERELWKAQQEEEVRKLEEVWERAKLHTEEQHEEMLLARLEMEREKFHGDMEEQEQRFQEVMELERNKLEVSHREVVQELRTKHSEEKEKLSCTLDKLRGDIAEERRELESLFSQRLRDVEARIMCDQDAVSDRFQSAMAKLEQHHQSELQALSEQHSKDWAKWEAEMEAASEAAQEHRRLLREAMQLEKDTLTQELAKERELLELRHKEEMEALRAKNLELQNELENFISSAQTKEIELSRHLNELHNRLQQNLNTRDELLAHSEKKVEEVEQLLHQAVQDFAVERTELQDNLSDLEAQYKETLAQAEKQLEERKNLLAEREQLTGKVREFEQLLQQAAEDFENEKLELKTNLTELQEKLSESASIAKLKQREEAELLAERNQLAVKIQRIEAELIPLLGPKRNMTTIVEEDEESLQLASTKADVNSEVKLETGCCGNCPENITFVVSACEDEIIEVDHSEDFIIFAEESSVDEEASHSDEKVACIEHAEADTDVIVVSVELHNKAVVIEDLDKINMARVEFVESSSGVAPQLAEIQNGLVVNTLEVTTCTELIDGPGGMAEVSRTETECADADHAGIKKVVEDVDADIKVNTGITHVDISGDDNSGENAKTESNSFFKSVESIDEPGININDKSESFYSLAPDLEYSSLETEFRNEADNSTTVMSQHGSSPKQKNRDESTSSMFTDREEVTCERDVCVRESLVLQNGLVQFQDQMCLIASLLTQYSVASGHNLVLQQKVAELQQRTDELEGPLGINIVEIDTSQQALEENCDVNALAQQAKEFEVKALELSELQIRHQECICENHRLEEKNGTLERRVQSLEDRMHVQNICDQHGALLDEIARMRKENSKLSALVQDLERQDKMFLTLQQDAIESSRFTSKAPYMDPGLQLETKMHAVSDLEDCCTEFERQNNRLRKALTDLQERSQTIHERMLAHRGEVGRLAEDNLSLRQKISELQIEDLRENHEDMLQKLENYRKEKVAAQKLAESLKRQISELHRRGQQLEDENIMLSQQNVENMASVVELSQQLGQVIQYSDRREGLRRHDNSFPDEKREMVACVSAMEAELNKTQEGKVQLEQERTHLLHQLSTLRDQLCEGVDFASAASRTQQLEEEKELLREELKRCVEKMAKLGAVEDQLTHVMHERQVAEKQNQGLRTQISKAHEKIQALDSTLQSTSVQTARFKSDLRVTQQERDNLKQEVMSLHNQLQNANDKSQVLEMALHSSGYQKQQKKLFWDEMSRLLEKEQTLLREENERLQREVKEMHSDLQRTREKARQLEAAVGSLRQQKQQSQACLAKAVEQEKVALKRELDALHKELLTTRSKVCESSEALREVESLRQENEGLRSKQARLESQLIEQGGILPQSPVRLPGEWRGHHHGDEQGPDFNLQEDREIAMLKMEGRMREVELTLRNVKMLLQEKVSQLKEQLHKNSKADIMIKDLYVENAQLLKALEMTEQRQKVAEKKNYLLEEKISSLNKIVRDLGPPALTAVPYHFTRS